jgi:hypothetical protein
LFKRWCEKAHADISRQAELVAAIELGANSTFDYVKTLSQELVRRYGEERERWVRSAAAVRAQVVESLLAGEPVDIDASSRRLGYELGRNHQAFVVWSDAWSEGGEQALAMLERAALALVGSLGASTPLLVPRARLLLVGWIGWRGERAFEAEPSSSTPGHSPKFSPRSVRPRTEFPASAAAAAKRSMPDASPS